MKLPCISVNHRFGFVFLHHRRKTRLGVVTTVARITPEIADGIAHALFECAARARKEPKPKLRLMKARRA